jgi:hypothetical protein
MILNSNQPLLLRSMRLNEKNYYENTRKSKLRHIHPAEFMTMLDGNHDHEHPKYRKENINKLKSTYLRIYMSHLLKNRNFKRSSSALLLTGVWSDDKPLMRFREQYFCSIIDRNYKKKIYTYYSKLCQNRRARNFNFRKLAKHDTVMLLFRKCWAKIWIYSMFKDKLDWSLEFAMRKLEINKRVL